jgi:hypothetical protein
MARFLKSLILSLGITVFFGGGAFAQPAISFDAVTKAYVSGTNTIKVEWKLTRAATTPEGMRVVVLKNGTALSDVKLSTQQSGVANVQGAANQQLKIELRSPANAVIASKDMTVASQPPASQSGADGASTDTFRFKNTLFGDNITAPQYVRSLYIWSVGIAILGASGMIIYAGYKYTASRGNPSEISNAKEIIISSLVGLALLLLSFTILRFLGVNVKNATQESVNSTTTK